jgi:hypothetical protein
VCSRVKHQANTKQQPRACKMQDHGVFCLHSSTLNLHVVVQVAYMFHSLYRPVPIAHLGTVALVTRWTF